MCEAAEWEVEEEEEETAGGRAGEDGVWGVEEGEVVEVVP